MNTIIGFPKPQVACSIHAGGTLANERLFVCQVQIGHLRVGVNQT